MRILFHLQNMGEGDLCRPISLERVDADVPVRRDVGVIDLREEKPAGRRMRKVVAQDELDVERSPVVRRPDCCLVVAGRGSISNPWTSLALSRVVSRVAAVSNRRAVSSSLIVFMYCIIQLQFKNK